MELNKTIQHYFHQPSLDSVSMPELEKAVERFPYSAALQFLLLKKMHQEKHPGFEAQFGRASLFYPNPWLLRDLLQFRPHPVKEYAAPVAAPESMEPPSAISAAPELTESVTTAIVEPEPPSQSQPEDLTQYQAEPLPEPLPVTPIPPEPNPAESISDISADSEEAASELRTELLMKESPIKIPSLKDLSPQTDEMPLFEPYHTIDYFASQGIKLSQELPVNDKLGRQMKSFTEWIRIMKKLPQSQIERQLLVAATGENIVAMAAGSVKMEEVITETMAEVLVKQGNIAKAIDLYNKLSLAHPDKSAYFATRIEQLKHS